MTRNPDYDFIIPSSPWLWLMNLGLLTIVVATAMPIFRIGDDLFRYIYAAGAAVAIIGRIAAPRYRGTIVRIIRLGRIEFWSCTALCMAAAIMLYDRNTARDWLALTLAGGALQIYTSLMIPATMRKMQAERRKKD